MLNYIHNSCQVAKMNIIHINFHRKMDTPIPVFPLATSFVFPEPRDKHLIELYTQFPKIRNDVETLLRHYHNWTKVIEKIPEESIQKVMERICRGRSTECASGTVDIWTPTYLVEIERWTEWAGSIGQVLSHGKCYPEHKLYICLFGQRHQYDICVNVVNDFAGKIEMVEFERLYFEFHNNENKDLLPTHIETKTAYQPRSLISSIALHREAIKGRMPCRSFYITHKKIALAPPGDVDCEMCSLYYKVYGSAVHCPSDIIGDLSHLLHEPENKKKPPTERQAISYFTSLIKVASHPRIKAFNISRGGEEYGLIMPPDDLRLARPVYENPWEV